jgi:hypothetical protein
MAHEHEFYFYACTNEDGWKCCACDEKPGEPPGFSPELDRKYIARKVFGLLDDLHNHDLVHVSNGCGGDSIVAAVSERCRREGVYDQQSILAFILGEDGGSHARYWKEISDGIIAGQDPRDRCHCGALATCSRSTGSGWIRTCSEHIPPLFDDPPKKARKRKGSPTSSKETP